MADSKVVPSIKTLDGISEARDDLYQKLVAGDISETRALAQERVLRGQVELKATVPLRMLSIVMKSKHAPIQQYGEFLLKRIVKFTTGEDAPAVIEQQVEK